MTAIVLCQLIVTAPCHAVHRTLIYCIFHKSARGRGCRCNYANLVAKHSAAIVYSKLLVFPKRDDHFFSSPIFDSLNRTWANCRHTDIDVPMASSVWTAYKSEWILIVNQSWNSSISSTFPVFSLWCIQRPFFICNFALLHFSLMAEQHFTKAASQCGVISLGSPQFQAADVIALLQS